MCAEGGATASPSSVLTATRDIWRRDGVAGFMHGNLSACVRAALYGAIKMATWVNLRTFLEDETGRMRYAPSVATSLCCASTSTITTSSHMIRTAITGELCLLACSRRQWRWWLRCPWKCSERAWSLPCRATLALQVRLAHLSLSSLYVAACSPMDACVTERTRLRYVPFGKRYWRLLQDIRSDLAVQDGRAAPSLQRNHATFTRIAHTPIAFLLCSCA
jgi:hypothetical protein